MDNKNYPRVQIIINADSNKDIQESVKWLSGTVDQSATEWPSESPATKVKRDAPENIKAKGEAPDDILEKEAAPKKSKKVESSSKKDSEPKITLDDLRKKMSAVLKNNKRDEAKALLAEFEAPKLGELATEKYADFNKGLDALLGGD